ncbi:hypothetical protein D3C81_1367720 [compost metagenome]
MEVGVGQLDVAQGRHLELEAVDVLAGQPGNALGGVFGLVGFHLAHLLERVAAGRRAVVAGHAARFLEQLVAVLLGLGQRLLVALQPAVEARVGRGQGLLELGDGVGDRVDGDLVGLVGLLDRLTVLRDRADHGHCLLVGEGHFLRVGDRAAGLLLEVVGAAVPELGDVHSRVEHGRRIDRPFLPVVADRGRQVVAAARAQVVAGVAGDDAGLGQARVEEQLLAQFDLGRLGDLGRFDRLDRFVVRLEGPGVAGQQQAGGEDQGFVHRGVLLR